MPLETASTIADLVSTNPVGASDTPASLDDHIRLIKTVLKADALVDADIGVAVQAYDADIPTVAASQVEMEEGTEAALRSMSPLRVAQAISALASVVDASETVKGKIELATNAEVVSGTDAVRAVTPAGMKAGLNAGGTAPTYACRAWCTFDGTVAGTNSPTAGGNVTSVTRNGTGDYTINFSTALEDANYSVSLSSQYDTSSGDTISTSLAIKNTVSPTTSALRIVSVGNSSATMYDSKRISVMVFR